MEQRGGPKALTVGIWTGLKDRAHSRMGAESGRQERGGGWGEHWRKGGPSSSWCACPSLLKGASEIHCRLRACP